MFVIQQTNFITEIQAQGGTRQIETHKQIKERTESEKSNCQNNRTNSQDSCTLLFLITMVFFSSPFVIGCKQKLRQKMKRKSIDHVIEYADFIAIKANCTKRTQTKNERKKICPEFLIKGT